MKIPLDKAAALERLNVLEREGAELKRKSAELVEQGRALAVQCTRTVLLEELYQELVRSGLKFKRQDGGENELAIIMANLGRQPMGV